jgi:hypothetical protein
MANGGIIGPINDPTSIPRWNCNINYQQSFTKSTTFTAQSALTKVD